MFATKILLGRGIRQGNDTFWLKRRATRVQKRKKHNSRGQWDLKQVLGGFRFPCKIGGVVGAALVYNSKTKAEYNHTFKVNPPKHVNP